MVRHKCGNGIWRKSKEVLKDWPGFQTRDKSRLEEKPSQAHTGAGVLGGRLLGIRVGRGHRKIGG